MATAQRILIVGGGIAGQTLACALARQGLTCEIVEIRPDWQIAGAAMTLQGNALRALRDIGLAEATVAAGWRGGVRPLVFTDTLGQTVMEPDVLNMVGPGYPPQIAIRRQALHEVLLRAVQAARVPIRMGITVKSINDTGSEVQATFTDGRSQNYDLVVGADGIRSTVRSLVFGDIQPRFAGFANWRALLPRPPSVNRMMWMWGHGRSVGVLPLDGDQVFVAGVTKEKDATRYPPEDLARLFCEKFKSFGGALPDVLARAGEGPWLYTVMEEITLDPPWYKGRVVLLGDAAHAACPFWAQGAAMAMEDSVVLAGLLGTGHSVAAALAEWMQRRHARCLYVQKGSYDTGVLTHIDPESDQPKQFPAAFSEIVTKQFHVREAKMAEPI